MRNKLLIRSVAYFKLDDLDSLDKKYVSYISRNLVEILPSIKFSQPMSSCSEANWCSDGMLIVMALKILSPIWFNYVIIESIIFGSVCCLHSHILRSFTESFHNSTLCVSFQCRL